MTQPRRRNYRLLALGTAPILVGLLLRAPPPPSDPVVRTLGEEFRGQVRRTEYLRVASRGERPRPGTFVFVFVSLFCVCVCVCVCMANHSTRLHRTHCVD